jgi:hypothetical protein
LVRDSQIGSAIVEGVVVDVIYLLTKPGSDNDPMHQKY